MIEVALTHARAVFTVRNGGVSEGVYASLNLGLNTGDDKLAVRRNLDDLKDHFSLPSIQLLKQVHGGEYVSASSATTGTQPIGDALVTSDSLRGLLTVGADCPSVLLASKTRVAAVHCGWRPVAAGLIERVTGEFSGEVFEAAIGPGICRDHFEVGDEVVDAMGEDGAEFTQGRQMDLAGIIERRLLRAGATRVQSVDRCTFCEPEHFFSYRRDGVETGRQGGLVWRV